MDKLLVTFITGLSTGMILFLVSSGLTLIWGTSRVFNMAHASFFMLSAYLMYTLTQILFKGAIFFWFGLILCPIIIAILGGIIETTFVRRLYGAEESSVILFFIGLIYIFSDTVKIGWGSLILNVKMPAFFHSSFTIIGQSYPSYFIVVLGLSALITGGLWIVFYRTRFGLFLRAAVMDRVMLEALGINTDRLFTITFLLGCWLAGVAGCLIAPMRAIEPTMDSAVLIEAIAVIVIGGLGSVFGSLWAAIIIGEFGAFGIIFFPYLPTVLTFFVMGLVIFLRPQGLMGNPEAVK
jgi:branched-chain amino acid transport system permease protein